MMHMGQERVISFAILVGLVVFDGMSASLSWSSRCVREDFSLQKPPRKPVSFQCVMEAKIGRKLKMNWSGRAAPMP